MTVHKELPKYLDSFVYNELNARYERTRGNMTVIDWKSREEQLKYLGTYFPRSYTESFCIFLEFFNLYKSKYLDKKTLKVIDVGCGSGGELIGFLEAAQTILPNLRKVVIFAYDGNPICAKFCQAMLGRCAIEMKLEYVSVVQVQDVASPAAFDDFNPPKDCDFFFAFKTLNEFVIKKTLEDDNPYKRFVDKFRANLSDTGVICIADITSQIPPTGEWCPTIIDQGIRPFVEKGELYALQPYSGTRVGFFTSHSRVQGEDNSNLTWRLLCGQDWRTDEEYLAEDAGLPW